MCYNKRLFVILNTNKIQEKICAEILYIRDCRLDFFQILNGVEYNIAVQRFLLFNSVFCTFAHFLRLDDFHS